LAMALMLAAALAASEAMIQLLCNCLLQLVQRRDAGSLTPCVVQNYANVATASVALLYL
jgi:hypothetical protein